MDVHEAVARGGASRHRIERARLAPAATAAAPVPAERPSPWAAYWAHLPCHHEFFASEAAFFVRRLSDVVGDVSNARVLDFGCGFGLVAAALAPRVREIELWDASPPMRWRAQAHVASIPNARVAAALPDDRRFDLVVVNSVIQYLTPSQRRSWLAFWCTLLRPAGMLVLSDVPVDTSRNARLREVVELVTFHRARAGLLRVLHERAGDAIAYWRAVRAAPLTTLSPATLEREAALAGFAVMILPESLTSRRRRFAALLRPLDHPTCELSDHS